MHRKQKDQKTLCCNLFQVGYLYMLDWWDYREKAVWCITHHYTVLKWNRFCINFFIKCLLILKLIKRNVQIWDNDEKILCPKWVANVPFACIMSYEPNLHVCICRFFSPPLYTTDGARRNYLHQMHPRVSVWGSARSSVWPSDHPWEWSHIWTDCAMRSCF